MPHSLQPLLPVNQQAVRRHNLALVLRMIREHGPMSRTDLVGATGLNKVTVSSLVSDLVRRRLVREAGQRPTGGAGRPARMLESDGGHVAAAAAEINVDRVSLLVTDLTGVELVSLTAPMPAGPPSPALALDTLATLVTEAERSVRPRGAPVAGLRIGIPGMVDSQAGVVEYAPSLRWTKISVASTLRRILRRPHFDVRIDRLANYAVYAEYRFGEWDEADIAVLYGDVGIGCGQLVDGRLLRGSAGLAGEFGHLPLDPRGPQCECGRRGCLNAMVGLRRLVPDTAGSPAGTAERSQSALDEILIAAERGDPRLRQELQAQGKWLARGAAIVVHLVNPQVLVLGGYFSKFAPFLWDSFEAELRDLVMPLQLDGCTVAVSTLDGDAALRGASALLTDELLADPARIATEPR